MKLGFVGLGEMGTLLLGSTLFVFYAGYLVLMLLKSRQSNNKGTSVALKVSLVIPTYNEETTITKKLQNVMEQNYPRKLLEIIVIDSGSTDATVKLVEDFANKSSVPIRILREKERKGKAAALNNAFQHCTGDITLISDADAILEKDAISQVVSNFANPKIGAVTGRQILLNPGQTKAAVVEHTYRGIYELLRVGESMLDSTPIFHGEISAFRTELLEPISPDSMADDTELAIKIRKKGYRSVYDPSAIFYEYAPPSFKSRFIQKVRRGQGLIQVFWRQKAMLFNPKYGLFGMLILPAEFFMHIISPILVLAFIILFLVTLAQEAATYLLLAIGIAVVMMLLLYLASFISPSKTRINIVNFIATFLNSQFILLAALLYHLTGKKQHEWRKVEEIRSPWR